jgi:hypothetical protein
VTLHSLGRGPVLLRHGLRRKEKKHSLNPSNSIFFFPFPFSSFFFSLSFSGAGNEARRERRIVQEDVGVRKGDHLLL